MKTVFVLLSCLLAAGLVAAIIVGSGLRAELHAKNDGLAREVDRLKGELSAAGPQVAWRRYENRELGFELRYPPELFSGEAATASAATARNGLKGILLSRPTSGCVVEVYRGSASAASNPFDETGVASGEARYAASARLTFGGLSYYVGMGVVSHAVDPRRTCIPAFRRILPTIRFLPRPASPGQAVAAPEAGPGIDAESLRRLQDTVPPEALRDDLLKHPELIPFHGTLGGTPAFHDPSSIVLLPGRWVYATFDDGHVEGRLIAAWELTPDHRIMWKLVTAECPGC